MTRRNSRGGRVTNGRAAAILTVMFVVLEARGATAGPSSHDLSNARIRVAGQAYPCLREADLADLTHGAPESATAIGREIDASLDSAEFYSPDAYEEAATRLREQYRAEGFLSAEVGPVGVLRRRCVGG